MISFLGSIYVQFFVKMIHRILYGKASKKLYNLVLAKIGFYSVEYPLSLNLNNNIRS